MAGTVHGIVNIGETLTESNNRRMFQYFADFFDYLATVPGGNYMTRIASQYQGGTGWSDCGQNSFGVWRFNTSTARPGGGSQLGAIYLFMAWHDGTASGGWQVDGSTGTDGTGLVAAFREDGSSPWNGTTNDNGLDTIGSPLWTGADAHVLSVANETGSYSVNKNSAPFMGDFATNKQVNLHMLADEDNIALFFTVYGGVTDARDWRYWLLLTVDPIATVTSFVADYPVMCAKYGGGAGPGVPSSQTFGVSTLSTTSHEGGIAAKNGANLEVQPVSLNRFYWLEGATRQPNHQSDSSTWDEGPLAFVVDNGALSGFVGYHSEFMRMTYTADEESWDATNQRVAMGDYLTDRRRWSIPWPTAVGEAPGATRTPAGVSF